MEFREYLRVIRKRWIGIVAAIVMGVGTAATFSIVLTPRYEASTLVFVYVQSSTVGDLAQGSTFAQNQVKSYAEAVNSPRVLDSVIKDLDLDLTAVELAEDVAASAPLDTVNIEITVTHSSPTRAADIANAVTASFRDVITAITKPATGPSQVSISVLRSATVPEEPVSPNLKINLAIGFLAGLVIGLGTAVLVEVLDTRLRTAADVEALTDVPIIGRIAADKHAVKRPLIVHDDPQSPRAEAFRTMRTNLQFLEIDRRERSFAVTSAVSHEGKTTATANLAIAIAAAGASVVVVDADLRRSALAGYFGLEGAVGLSDVLISRVKLDDALQEWGDRRLTVLPAGTTPPNPSELLGSQAMVGLLDRLGKDFDVVLLDLPPVLPVTDAAVVSGMVGGTLVVAAAGRVTKAEFASAIASLQKVNAPIAGIVLTFLPPRGPENLGYQGYSYSAGTSR